MRYRRYAALVAGAVFGLASAASAADLPTKAPVYKAPVAAPPFSWAGFYIGVNAGAGWSRSDVSNAFTGCASGCYLDVPTAAYVSSPSSGDITDTRFIGGGQAGYNWQTGALVLGVETDLDYLGVKVSRSVHAPYHSGGTTGVDVNDEVKADYLGTVRGRIGYSSGTFLLYGTGGLAYTTLKHSHNFSEYGYGPTPCLGGNYCDLGGSSESKFRAGWTVGGGLEWAFNRNWSVKAEYLYADLGSVSSTTNYYYVSGTSPPSLQTNSAVNHSADLVVQMARVGLNYRF